MNRTIISDKLSGKSVWQQYKTFKKSQWYSKEEMKELQGEKLKKLFIHCYENVKYYKKIIVENNINIYSNDPLDTLHQFPILTKELIQENYLDFIPLNNKKIAGVLTKQTGGTTGNILYKRNDANTRSSIWASYKRYEDWMGYKSGDRVLRLMGGHIKKSPGIKHIKELFINYLNNTTSINIYNTSNETIEKTIGLLKKNRFSHIRSYPQFLYSLAQYINKKGLKFNINSISTTAEPVMQEHRSLFKKVFNAEVFDQYGCGEIGGVAYECDHHNGLHVAEERVIIETNDKNELIMTDLDNYTMPFIKYWNEDQAILHDELCTCGRASKLIKKIMGRTCDYIIGKNDEFLHWAYIWHLIFDSNIATNRNLKKFQVVQKNNDHIVIRLVSDKLQKDEEEFLSNDLKSRLGEINIQYIYEIDIENTKTGKYRPVINHILKPKGLK